MKVALRRRDGSIAALTEIDPCDAERVEQFTWRLHPDGYACRYCRVDGRFRVVMLHHFILGVVGDRRHPVDHMNRDKLDNRRENLRVCSPGDNARNRGSFRGSSSQHSGVWRRGTRWSAMIKVEGVRHYLGSFPDEDSAGCAAAEFRAALVRESVPS